MVVLVAATLCIGSANNISNKMVIMPRYLIVFMFFPFFGSIKCTN